MQPALDESKHHHIANESCLGYAGSAALRHQEKSASNEIQLAYQITTSFHHHGAEPSAAAVGLAAGIHKPVALPHTPTVAPELPVSPAVTLDTSWVIDGAERPWYRHQRHSGLTAGAAEPPFDVERTESPVGSIF